MNNRERINLFYPLNELRSAGYITEEAHSYFAAKRSNRFQDYVQLREAISNELMNKINNNYQDVMEITGHRNN